MELWFRVFFLSAEEYGRKSSSPNINVERSVKIYYSWNFFGVEDS